jgi:hypothetical protein
MANAGKQQVARCPSPKCGKAIWIDHPYTWCQERGDPLPDDIKVRLPKLGSVTAKISGHFSPLQLCRNGECGT